MKLLTGFPTTIDGPSSNSAAGAARSADHPPASRPIQAVALCFIQGVCGPVMCVPCALVGDRPTSEG
jgi:hypothetical protein